MNELAALGLGLALGIVTGMPLGVVNTAIVHAATQDRTRFATGMAIGAGLADAIHASIAFAGVGQLSAEYTRPLAIATAVTLVAYIAIARRVHRREHGSQGVLAGFMFTLPNPAALAAWVAIASATWPTISTGNALILGAAVGFGSAAWFAVLARLAKRWRPTWLPKVATVVLVALAAFGLVRAFAVTP